MIIIKKTENNNKIIFTISFAEVKAWKEILKKAKLNLGKNLKIKGFRKGQIPSDLLNRYIKNYDILQEGTEIAQNLIQKKISSEEQQLLKTHRVSKNKVTKISQDNFEVILEWEKMPHLKGKIKKYKNFKISFPQIKITKKDIDHEMNKFREVFASYENIEKKIVVNDFVLLNYEGYFEQKKIPSLTKKETRYKVGSNFLSKEFDNALLGMKKNDIKKIEVTLPLDFNIPEFKNKKIIFDFKVVAVQKQILANLDDHLVQKLKLKDINDLKTFRKKIAEVLKQKIINQKFNQISELLWKKIITFNDFDLPISYIETENKRLQARFNLVLSEKQIKFEDYLKQNKLTKKEWETKNYDDLVFVLKKQLCVYEIAEIEKINVSKEEIESYYKHIAKREQIDLENAKKSYREINLYNGLLFSKIDKFIFDNVIEFNNLIVFEE